MKKTLAILLAILFVLQIDQTLYASDKSSKGKLSSPARSGHYKSTTLEAVLNQDKSVTITGKALHGERKALLHQYNPYAVQETGTPFTNEKDYEITINDNGAFKITTEPVTNKADIKFTFEQIDGYFYHEDFMISLITLEGSEFTYSEYQLDGLNYLNSVRSRMNLTPVYLNPYISKAAVSHAQYLIDNDIDLNVVGLGAHYQSPGKIGFTGNTSNDRVGAAGLYMSVDEVISPGKSIEEAIDYLLSTLYHRMPLIDPNTTEIGIGFIDGMAVINTKESPGYNATTVYPYDGMTNTPIGFYGNEIPNPIEEFGISKTGGIITFRPNFHATNLAATISNSLGEKLPFYRSFYNDQPVEKSQEVNTSGVLYPAIELDYNEKYTVSIDYMRDGRKENYSWSFTTKENPARNSKDRIKLTINGKEKFLTNPPLMDKGGIYVPLRDVFERLNASVNGSETAKTMTVTKQQTEIILTDGKVEAVVNGKSRKLNQAPRTLHGTLYVPLKTINALFGGKVSWDAKNNTATIVLNLGEPVDLSNYMNNRKEKLSPMNQIIASVKEAGYKIEKTIERSDSTDYIVTKDGKELFSYVQYIPTDSSVFNGNISFECKIGEQNYLFSFMQDMLERQTGVIMDHLGEEMAELMNPDRLKENETVVLERSYGKGVKLQLIVVRWDATNYLYNIEFKH